MSTYEQQKRAEHLPLLEARIPNTKSLPTKLYVEFWEFVFKHAHEHWAVDFFPEVAKLLLQSGQTAPLSTTLKTLLPLMQKITAERLYNPILDTQMPVEIQDAPRFAHTWILAQSDTGKTNLLENFIHEDLKKVREGKATVLVMDSQGDKELLGRIKHPALTINTNTPLNIFSIARHRAHTPRDQEILHNNAINLITYVFSATLGDGGAFTIKQKTCFDFCVQLLLATPNATILDMIALLAPKGLERYQEHVSNLSPIAQLFFQQDFDHPKQYTDTKLEIRNRIMTVMRNQTFARMFSNPRSIDFFTELSKPQLIKVDTDKALLGNEGTEIFGRMIIAMLLSASQQRAILTSADRLPVFCYIDECADYISTDTNIATIIDQARKMRIAFTFAHQRISHIKDPNVVDALNHCAVKFSRKKQYVFNYTVGDAPTIEVQAPVLEHPVFEDTSPEPQILEAIPIPLVPMQDKDEVDISAR